MENDLKRYAFAILADMTERGDYKAKELLENA